jgi:hypothetical protein
MDITWAEERSQRLGMHIAAFHGPGYGGSDYYRFTLEFLVTMPWQWQRPSGMSDSECWASRRQRCGGDGGDAPRIA